MSPRANPERSMSPSSLPDDALPSTSWVRRLSGDAVRRAGFGVLAAVTLSAVAPALANAAGGNVPNPVVVALRNGGDALSEALGSDDDECTPAPEETDGTGEGTGTNTDTDTGTGTDTGDEQVSQAPVPAESGDAEDVDDPTDECDDDEADEATESPTTAPTPSESESPEDDEDSDSEHGSIVSTVAKCAPRGQDPLLDVDGAPSNHGGYVRVAAHGGVLTTPFGTFDLSTQAGADALCAALPAARAAAEAAAEDDAQDEAKKDKKNKKNKKGKGKNRGNGAAASGSDD
jgi:hypothetical protein